MDTETINNNSIKLRLKFSTAITYLVIGLLLASFTFDIGYISYFQYITSVVCIFLGLRLIKDLKLSFKWAYYISIYLLLTVTVISLLKMISPIINELGTYQYVNIFINLLMMFFISIGLNTCINSHHNLSFIALYIVSDFLGILIRSGFVSILIIIIFVISVFLPIRSLWKCRQEIKYGGEDITLKSPRIESSVFVGGWTCLCIGLSLILPYVWPLLMYEYIAPYEQETYEHIVDERTNIELFDKVTVYDVGDEYQVVFKSKKENLQKKYSCIDIQLIVKLNSDGYLFEQPQMIAVSDENGTLDSQVVIQEQMDGLFYNGAENVLQRFYLNPLAKDNNITISLTISKNILNSINDTSEELNEEEEEVNDEDDTYSSITCSINIQDYKYGLFGDNPEKAYSFITINKDGKIDWN